MTGDPLEQSNNPSLKKSTERSASARTTSATTRKEHPEWGGDTKLIYQPADLYFAFLRVQPRKRPRHPGPEVFVEAVDRSFENVCELDLIFHSYETYVLDEIIIGGLVLDTPITNIMGAPTTRTSSTSRACRC